MESRGLGSFIVLLTILILFLFYKRSNIILKNRPSNIPTFVIESMLFFRNNYHSIVYITSFLFILIIYINIMGYQMDPAAHEHVTHVYTIESFKENIQSDSVKGNNLSSSISEGLCTHHKGSSENLELDCNTLTETTCNTSSCCGWLKTTNGIAKCVAGTNHGPKYKTDNSGNKLNIDQYYYQNKCYGNTCSS